MNPAELRAYEEYLWLTTWPDQDYDFWRSVMDYGESL